MFQNVVLRGVIGLHLARVMTLHCARVNLLRLHVAIFGQEPAVSHNSTVPALACVEDDLYWRSHLLEVTSDSLPDLEVCHDVEEVSGVLISQHSSLLWADGGICEEPVASEEDWPFVAVLLRSSHSPGTIRIRIQTLLGHYQDILPNISVLEFINEMRLFSE